MHVPAATVAPLAYSPAQAARALGISRSTLYTLVKDGRIPIVKIGTRSVIRHAALLAFLDALDKAA
jgi:excisionase family DNA binding protein